MARRRGIHSTSSKRISFTSKSRGPPGLWTVATSPSRFPIRARATGEVMEMSRFFKSASGSPTIRYRTSRSVSWSTRTTVAPNTTWSPFNLLSSITSAWAIQLSRSLIRPSMWDCFSLAAWYSEFSRRSPCPRATSISLLILIRSTVFSCFSSSLSLRKPAAVIGTVALIACSLSPSSLRDALAISKDAGLVLWIAARAGRGNRALGVSRQLYMSAVLPEHDQGFAGELVGDHLVQHRVNQEKPAAAGATQQLWSPFRHRRQPAANADGDRQRGRNSQTHLHRHHPALSKPQHADLLRSHRKLRLEPGQKPHQLERGVRHLRRAGWPISEPLEAGPMAVRSARQDFQVSVAKYRGDFPEVLGRGSASMQHQEHA